MDNNTKTKLLSKLVCDSELKRNLRERKRIYEFSTIACTDTTRQSIRESMESENWEFERDFKHSIKMRNQKSHDVIFENKVWALFANLGFKFMNNGRDFNLPYDSKSSQQIDVFAKDDESVIYVECKAAKARRTNISFKNDLEAWQTKKAGVETSIKKLFPNEKLKTKFIFATEKQGMGEKDLERLEKLGGVHFDEDKIKYFIDMHKQLGEVARYQMLGYLFSGTTIPEMDNKIPAICGKMGGHTYYSFSIEPEKLLKIGYVLHRSKANKEMLPTYQRVIRKSRLKAVSAFINDEKNPGYFPNSIIINIDSKRKVNFDPSEAQVPNAISKLGILHLPKQYKSAYIIDGQHRLYGYANSRYSKTNSIPVVAFVNLSKSEQVNLFMQINENQKAVPKALRATLNADLKWESNNKKDQLDALCSKIAISLSEDTDSCLYQYITVGEDTKVLTPDSISNGLKKGKFLGKVSKDSIEELGFFYKGNLDDAYNHLLLFLKLNFEYLTDNLADDFKERKNSFLFVNKGITATLIILSDILELVLELTKGEKGIDTQRLSEESKKYLDPIIQFVKKDMDEVTRANLMVQKGAGGPTKYWRTFQVQIHKQYPEFSPNGLAEYIKNEERALNSKTYELIKDLEDYMRKDFKDKLMAKLGEEWAWKKGVPEKIQEDAEKLMRKKNRSRAKDEETSEWDNLNLIHYREIASRNWTHTNEDKTRGSFFDHRYTLPGEGSLKKDDKTKWFVKLNEIRNIVSHSSSDQVSEEQYSYVKNIHSLILPD